MVYEPWPTEPIFGSQGDSGIPVRHLIDGNDHAVIFQELEPDGTMRLYETIELPHGSSYGRRHNHDPVGNPGDICAELTTVRLRRFPAMLIGPLFDFVALVMPGGGWLLTQDQHSMPFVIDGEAIRDALSAYGESAAAAPSPP